MNHEIKFRFPKDIPLGEYPQPEIYLEEARRLTEEAQQQGLVLRVMGSIALYFYFPLYVDLYRRMQRPDDHVFTGIDYAAYGKQRGKLVLFFESQGYLSEKRAAMLSGGERLIFFSNRTPMIHVFFDRLDCNHPINYRGRLEAHTHCVSLTDLLLQKLQIVQITDKDLRDAMLLLLAAEVGESGQKTINAKYVAKLMSDDWGFYYTATTNLEKIKEASGKVPGVTEGRRAVIGVNADRLRVAIENAPKTRKWKAREKIGIRKIWYNKVSDPA